MALISVRACSMVTPGFSTPDGRDVMRAVLLGLSGSQSRWASKAPFRGPGTESGRHHADDRVAVALSVERLPDDVRISCRIAAATSRG